MCTCQIQTAVVFLFFLCGSKHQAYKPPSFSQSSCWYRAVMSCSVSTVCIREMPSLSAASFDIYLQCKSVLGSKAIDEWKWKANELWSVSAYLPSCAFKNALRLLLSRTQEKPPEPYSTIRQTLLTRVFVSLSNTDKVLYTIMFACVPLRVLFFFLFSYTTVSLLQRQPAVPISALSFFVRFSHIPNGRFSCLREQFPLEASSITVYIDIINVWFVLEQVLWPSWS